MSFLTNVEADLGIIETDVVKFFSTTLPNFETAVLADIQAAASWLVNKALPWMAAHSQEIATDVAGVAAVAASAAAAGVPVPAAVILAGETLTKVVAGVNTVIQAAQAASTQSGAAGATAVKQAVAAGQATYVAIKGLQQTASAAQAAVASPQATLLPTPTQ